MASIDERLDLGNGMNLPSFWDDIEDVHEKEKHYNSLLSLVESSL